MYLLDTNIISETRKPRPHGGVLAWIRSIPPEQLFLSAVTMGELQRGLERVYENDLGKAQEIHRWIDRLAGAFEVIPADGAIFRRWASLTKGRSKHLWEDALIAATAYERGLTIATRNTKDFEAFSGDFHGTSLQIYNPFHYSVRD